MEKERRKLGLSTLHHVVCVCVCVYVCERFLPYIQSRQSHQTSHAAGEQLRSVTAKPFQ